MKKRENLKTTDISLIKEIPYDWEVKKIKHILYEVSNKSESGLEDLLSLSQYTGVELKKDKKKNDKDNLTNALSLVGYKVVLINQLVSNIMLAWNGSMAISKHNGIISPAYCIYQFRNGFNPKFFEYLFKTEVYKAEFKRKSTGIIESRLRLYSDQFYNIHCVVPSIVEQNKIVEFIDFKQKQIQNLIRYTNVIFGKTNPKTGLLQEYINTLIFNLVTGKIDVKNYEIPNLDFEAKELEAFSYLEKKEITDMVSEDGIEMEIE
ncbi:Restriction endonuclease S subunit (fragment) [Flavobacterium psychrophilum]|uniref:restriction endonuclease subunit S n=1 Tax=Flavobacterium psychrophilum TaxID=96345 RepID=UPI000B7C188D